MKLLVILRNGKEFKIDQSTANALTKKLLKGSKEFLSFISSGGDSYVSSKANDTTLIVNISEISAVVSPENVA